MPHIGIRKKARGFTLLEVIIAMTLVSSLMVILWSLFSTFTRLEERSSRAASELQLVRSLSRQLRSDLDHFATLPLPPATINSDGRSRDDASENAEVDSAESGDDSAEEDTDSSEDSESTPASTDDDRTDSTRQRSSLQTVTPRTPIQTLPADTLSQANIFTQGDANPQDAFGASTPLTRDDLNAAQTFRASLPSETYLRGTATRLEMILRMPYTVDVPIGTQRLGAESRYGTYLWVVWDYRDPRDLRSLLESDPILNPQLFKPDTNQQAPNQLAPNQPQVLNAPPQVATALNPNDNVGLSREANSWLQVTRDAMLNDLKMRAAASGLLVNGQLPTDTPQTEVLPLEERLRARTDSDSVDAPAGVAFQLPWNPPPEIRGRKEHLPEVTRLQFRYFDGESWLLSWEGENNRLPLAVEIAFDVDPQAPAARAKEFEAAHATVLGGVAVSEVLPDEELEELEPLALDTDLLDSNLVDPTAIKTEYRFVIAMPKQPKRKRDAEFENTSNADDAEQGLELDPQGEDDE